MISERIPRITVRKYFRAFAAGALCPVFSGISGSHIGQVKGLTEPKYNNKQFPCMEDSLYPGAGACPRITVRNHFRTPWCRELQKNHPVYFALVGGMPTKALASLIFLSKFPSRRIITRWA